MNTRVRAGGWWMLVILVVIMTGTAADSTLAGTGRTDSPVPITIVNGDEISIQDYQDRVRVTRWLTATQIREAYYYLGGDANLVRQYLGAQISDLQRPDVFGAQVLREMEEEVVLAQNAEAWDVTIDPAELDARINAYIAGFWEIDPETTDPTELDLIAQTREQWFAEGAAVAQVDEAVLVDMFYYDVLLSKIRDYLAQDVPTEELRVHARHILCAFYPDNPGNPTPPTDEEKAAALTCAEDAAQALLDDAAFADVAQTMSDDTVSGANGGDLGWANPDDFVPEFRDVVLNAEVGVVVGPFETQFGYHIVEVQERDIVPLTEAELNVSQIEAYQDWLREQMDSAEIERHPAWQDFVPDEPTYDELLGDLFGVTE